MRKVFHYQIFHVSIIVILAVSLTQTCRSQEPSSFLLEGQPKYILISSVAFSEPVYFDEENDERAGYKYRLVTTTSEIYNSIYLERIVIDIEESPVAIEFSNKIDLSSLYQSHDLSKETDLLVFKEWLSSNTFVIKIGDIPFWIEVIGDYNNPKIKISSQQ